MVPARWTESSRACPETFSARTGRSKSLERSLRTSRYSRQVIPSANVPPISSKPAAADTINYSNTVVTIPDWISGLAYGSYSPRSVLRGAFFAQAAPGAMGVGPA